MERVFFVGFGAIGVTFASQFQDAGYPLQGLCDGERKKRYMERGFTVNGKKYVFPFVEPSEVAVAPDVIFIAVKNYHLPDALNLLEGVVGPETTIISLLNGIRSEEVIERRYGPERTLPAFVAHTDATREGNNVTFHCGGRIIFGERDGGFSARVKKIARLLGEAGVDHQVSDEILRMMWWKFMVNVGMNQAGAILGAPYGTFQESTSCREVALSAMREVVGLAPHYGVDLTENDMHVALEMIDSLAPEGKNSMLQDVEAGRQTEVEAFAGEVYRRGLEIGVSTPVNRLFHHMIKTREYQKGIR